MAGSNPTRMPVGVRQRHGRSCKRPASGCKCPWQASVYSAADGKKIRKPFATKAEAVAWRDEARTAVRKKTLRAPVSTTVAEAAKAWLEGAESGLIRNRSGDEYKPAALRAYEAALRLRVEPEFGMRKLSSITRADLQDFVDGLIAEGLNASTIGVTINPLRAIYKRALARPDSGVVVNPTAGLALPAVRGGRDRVASPAECTKLLAALPAADRPLWATAMFAGLRRGELAALRIEDIDLGAGLIHVRRGWDQFAGEILPKNGTGRKVPIVTALRDYLDEHLLGLDWKQGLVFGATATRPFTTTAVARRATNTWTKAKLEPITLHECRHTFASLAIAAGANAKALSTYMGHANISITLDRYGHLMPGNEAEFAGLFDAYLQRTDTSGRVAQISATG
jgi:integrase